MKFRLTVLILLTFTGFCFSQPAGKGLKKLQLSVISENGKIKKQSFKKIDSLETISIIRSEISALHASGYLFAFDSISTDSAQIEARIYKGSRLKTTNDSAFVKTDNGEKQFYGLIKNGKYYSFQKTAQKKDEIVKVFENKGYPFVAVLCDSLISDQKTISFRYVIDKGAYIIYDSISLHGDMLVKEAFLRKYLQLPTGAPYNEKNVAAIPQRLAQTGFLECSRPPDLWFGKDKTRINIYLKKKKANRFEGIAGIVPPSGDSSKLSITGDISLYLVNSLKHADKISLNWKKYESQGQLLDVEFLYPYVFNYPAGIDLKFNLLKKDTSYINTQFKIGVPYFFGGNNFAGVKYEQKSSRLLTTIPLTSMADLNLNAAGLYFSWNNFDRLLIPRKGFGIEADVMTGKKEIMGTEGTKTTEDFFEQHAQLSFNFPVMQYFGIKAGIQDGLISGKNIYENELMRIGGYKTLRGFDEESLTVEKYVSASIEAKAFFGNYSNTFLFFNAANYYKNISKKITDTPLGFGWGVEIETPAGILSLIYALGKEFDNPIEFRNSRVHISLVNAF